MNEQERRALRAPTITYREQDGIHLTFMDGVRFGPGPILAQILFVAAALVLFVGCGLGGLLGVGS